MKEIISFNGFYWLVVKKSNVWHLHRYIDIACNEEVLDEPTLSYPTKNGLYSLFIEQNKKELDEMFSNYAEKVLNLSQRLDFLDKLIHITPVHQFKSDDFDYIGLRTDLDKRIKRLESILDNRSERYEELVKLNEQINT